jgi:hypothetical protein
MGVLVFVVIAGVVVLYYTYGRTSSKSRADKIYDEWINQSNILILWWVPPDLNPKTPDH